MTSYVKSDKLSSEISKSILIVCFHFPPIQGGSGVHRITSWCQYLSEMEWKITVLTVMSHAHLQINKENIKQIPTNVEVIRVPALDAARHLALWKRYPGWAAIPDRWQSWIVSGIFAGIQHIKKKRPSIILSTAPIPSAHTIALGLKKIFNIPWVADFRDPITGVGQEKASLEKLSRQWIEKKVIQYADQIIVTTPGTKSLYEKRYGNRTSKKINIIENGFDPAMFELDSRQESLEGQPDKKPLIFLHSGLIYPQGRNPRFLFEALAILRDQGIIYPKELYFVFRASGFSKEYENQYKHLKLEEFVKFEDNTLDHEQAIAEMKNAHALLVLQGSVFNAQIPAKIYEYLAVGKPILGLLDPEGDTANLMRQINTGTIMDMNDTKDIQNNLPKFIKEIKNNQSSLPDLSLVKSFSRKNGTMQLNSIIENLIFKKEK